MMRIDLRTQARLKGTRRKSIELTAIEPTKAQRNDLARLYLSVVRVWLEGARNQILPAYRQALTEAVAADDLMRDRVGSVEIAVDAVENEAVRATISFRGLFRMWADRVQLWHMRGFVFRLLYASNVDLSSQVSVGDVNETIDQVLARNVALIRDVSDQARGRISDIVFRGLQNRTPARDVGREISEAVGMSRDRSIRIAADQTQKLSATLDKERQLQVGMTSFSWMHSGKRHPRQEHLARDGMEFSWDSDVAKNDPPGYAPYCGCKARGLLKMEDD